MTIFSNSPEIGKVEEKMNVDNDNFIDISFSSKYMLEALRSFKSDKILINMIDNNSPIILKEVDNDSLIQLILPIKTY